MSQDGGRYVVPARPDATQCHPSHTCIGFVVRLGRVNSLGGAKVRVRPVDADSMYGRACTSYMQVAFAAVVGERHVEVDGGAQDLGFAVTEAFEQVPRLGLLAPVCSSVFGQPDEHGMPEQLQRFGGLFRWDLGQSVVAGGADGTVEVGQGAAGLSGPDRVRVLFDDRGDLPLPGGGGPG
jgi:hypothetical protein